MIAEPEQCVSHRRAIVRRNHEPGHAVLHDFGQARHARAESGRAARHAFEQRLAEQLRHARLVAVPVVVHARQHDAHAPTGTRRRCASSSQSCRNVTRLARGERTARSATYRESGAGPITTVARHPGRRPRASRPRLCAAAGGRRTRQSIRRHRRLPGENASCRRRRR